MKVTFIGHSCYLIETEKQYIVFDCMAFPEELEKFSEEVCGVLPEMNPEKELLVFVSHAHEDHYSAGIWSLQKKFPHIKYIISRDVTSVAEDRAAAGLPETDEERVLIVKGKKTYELSLQSGETLKIETFVSNDQGVAFFLTLGDKTIYHAGDLHYWTWGHVEQAVNDYLTSQFEKQLGLLRGRTVDVAFLLLDNRIIPEDLYKGMDMYLEAMDVKHMFPVHFWGRYDLLADYRETRKDRDYAKGFVNVEKNGQSFEIE